MPLQGSIALVTGVSGFVGTNLARRLLAERSIVHAIVRPETDLWRLKGVQGRVIVHLADLTDREAVRRVVDQVRPDVVFHLAKHSGNPATTDYRSAYDTNLYSTLHLLEAVQGRPLTRFVHTGSSLEYDLERSPLRESDSLAPRTVHGVTKAAAALLCQHFARRHGVPAVVLRVFTVYGSWEGPSRFVPRVMMAALDRWPLRVTRESLAHDWIVVDDVVDACLRSVVAADVNGEVINVGTGREATNEQVVSLVEELCGREIARAAEPFPVRPWDTTHWVADVAKARERLCWEAATDLGTGLARTLAWFRDHLSIYRERST